MADDTSILTAHLTSTLPKNHTCKICGMPSRYIMYCDRHYRQIWKHGKVVNNDRCRNTRNEIKIKDELAKISLYDKNGEILTETIIDSEDVEKCSVHKWSLKKRKNRQGYVRCDKYNLYLHRFVLDLKKNDHKNVDHINLNTLDNRKKNLRVCTAAQNARNQNGWRKRKHKYKGVVFFHGSFYARIVVDRKTHTFGPFKSELEAARAYDAAALRLHGSFARINGVSSVTDIMTKKSG